jgi:hypothetical protein
MSQMALVYGFSHTEQMSMSAIVWRHYYALIQRRLAEQDLRASQVATIPHLKAEDARKVLAEWRATATAPLRAIAREAGDSWESIRSWWRQVLGDANRE